MNGPDRRHLWMIVALLVLLTLPQGWAIAALLGLAVGQVAASRARRIVAPRALEPTSASDSVSLGIDAAGKRLLLSDQQLSAHGLIVGASGAGKSTTLLRILTDQIARGRPVVVIDMKGSPDFVGQLEGAAVAAGRRFRCWTPDGPSRWNPLAHGNATELKDKLIATERFTEPHYKRAAERYVQTVLQVLEHAHADPAPTLDEVVALMDPRRLPAMLRDVPREHAERVLDYVAGLTPDQLSAIRGLGTRLAIITESHTGPYLSPAAGQHPIDLRRALAGDEVVLFSLNSSTYASLSAQLGALVVQDLVAAMGSRVDLPSAGQAMIGVDEFSGLGAENIVSLLARGRASGLSVMLATQELADLDRVAPGLRDQVLGVTAVKIAHRQDVPASAQAIAQMAGTHKAWEETHQIAGRLLGGYDTGRGTRRQVEQFIVHPNEIKTLGTGEAVVITKVPVARVAQVRIAPPAQPHAPPGGFEGGRTSRARVNRGGSRNGPELG